MATEDRPVEPKALAAALALFTRAFVVADKQKQMHDRLLVKERRGETLAALPRWLVRSEELTGADKSPAGIATRFGALTGIQLLEGGAMRVSIGRALERGRQVASLWIGDNGRVAVVTRDDGSPLLVR